MTKGGEEEGKGEGKDKEGKMKVKRGSEDAA